MTVTHEEIFGPVVCLMRYDPEHEAIRIANGQAEGIAKAKQRGAYKGRKKSLGEGQILALIDRAAGGEPKTVLAKGIRHQPRNRLHLPSNRHSNSAATPQRAPCS